MEIELLAQSTWTLLILIAVADCTIPRWPHPYTCHITCSSTMRHWRFSPQEVGPNFLSLNLHRGFWGLWQLEFSGGKVTWLLRQEGAFHQAHVMLTLGIWPPYYKHKTHRDYRWLFLIFYTKRMLVSPYQAGIYLKACSVVEIDHPHPHPWRS